METEPVSLARAAKVLQVNVGTMRRWVREGRIPAKRVGRKYLIAPKVFEGLLAVESSDPIALLSPQEQEEPTVPSGELELMPVWLQLSAGWYRRLYLISRECSMTAAETLTRGIELVLREHKEKHKKSQL